MSHPSAARTERILAKTNYKRRQIEKSFVCISMFDFTNSVQFCLFKRAVDVMSKWINHFRTVFASSLFFLSMLVCCHFSARVYGICWWSIICFSHIIHVAFALVVVYSRIWRVQCLVVRLLLVPNTSLVAHIRKCMLSASIEFFRFSICICVHEEEINARSNQYSPLPHLYPIRKRFVWSISVENANNCSTSHCNCGFFVLIAKI